MLSLLFRLRVWFDLHQHQFIIFHQMSLNQVKGSVMCDIMGQAHAYSMGSNMNKWSGGFRETHTERKRIKKKGFVLYKEI